jgi:uncharacterized YccA/Bax inhibitor family protein
MRSSNPVFRNLEKTEVFSTSVTATYTGIVAKTAIMLLTAVITGFLAVNFIGELTYPLLIVSMIVAFISVMVAIRSPRLAPTFAMIYAIAEGVLLGVITLIFEIMFPGVAITAVIGTASIFTVMLFLYSSRTIRVTPRFRKIMYGILLGILLFFVSSMLINLFASAPIIIFSDSLTLVISGLLIIFGAFMLTLDFDRAEQIVNGGYGKEYEWMVAVGLMVTIVWIYLELMRFLAIIASNRN